MFIYGGCGAKNDTYRSERMKLIERLLKYGAAAYAKMRGFRGKKALKEIARLKKLIPTAPLEIEAKAPYISRSMRSYWKDVKSLVDARGIDIKSSRKLLKGLKTSKNVQVRVIKKGEGWQLVMLGLYENLEKPYLYEEEDRLGIPHPPVETKYIGKTQQEMEGHSYVHEEQDYDEALGECIREAQAMLGGSGWQLIKVLKETWIRYFGREV